jgi:hypothetical protein
MQNSFVPTSLEVTKAMKKVLLFLGLMSMLAIGPVATADESADESARAVAVPCCIRGKCKQLTASACRKSGGHVVDSCRKCRR